MRIIILIAILLGCSRPAPQEEPKLDRSYFWRDYDRAIGLLTIKYEVDSLKPIIVSYMKEYHAWHTAMLFENVDFDDKQKPVEDLIRELSVKYSVPEQLLSTVLFDFELWILNERYD